MSSRLVRTSLAALIPAALLLSSTGAKAADSHRPVVNRVAPVYPELARRMHVSGVVVVHVVVQPDGKVASTKVESGHALLATAAEEAVRQWRFAPGPDASESTIDVNFTPDGR